MGLYTQRAPGLRRRQDRPARGGGARRPLLHDARAHRRRRSSTAPPCAPSARLRPTYARNTADITDRNNIQYHWIEIESVPAIWERLEAVGLTTLEACGDSPRPFLGSPVAGIAKDEIIDGTEALAEIKRRALGNPEFSNLPRKFKTALTGHPSHDVAPEVNDVSFVGTVHPEHGPGFDLWVGGGLSTNPMLAHKLGVWIPLDEVADAWEGVAGDLPRLRLPPAALQGPAEVPARRLGQGEVPRGPGERVPRTARSSTTPPPRRRSPRATTSASTSSRTARFYVGAAPVVGRIDGTHAERARRPRRAVRRRAAPASRRTRSSSCIGVAADDAEAFADDLEKIGLTARPSNWRRSTMACTGIEFCKLAIVDTKERARRLVTELEKRFPDLDTPITVNVNGCPNACARTQVADIGLKGQLVLDDDGNQVEGFQVHLGGALGLNAELRPQAARPQGHQRRPRRLRHRGRRGVPRRPRPTARRFAAWVARADEVAAARGAGRSDDERAARLPFHCPYCGDENLFPHGGSRGVGVPRRACAPSPSG